MPTTANSITYFVAADGTLRDGQQGSISQQPRINYGTDYAVTLSFPPDTLQEGDQLQVALNRTRTFFSSASATGDAPVAAVAKHDVTAEEATAQAVTVTLSTNTRAMIDQVNGVDHPVRGFFGVHILRGQSFVTLAVADALMMSLESGPDAISPSLPVVDYPTREEAEALTDRSEAAAERAEQAAAGIVPPLQLDAPPTTSTVGSVGQLATWHDSATNKDHLYHLVFISTSDSATLYHWEECVLLDADGKINASIIPLAYTYGLKTIVYGGKTSLALDVATNANINGRSNTRAIVPSNLDYAVRSVLPNITEIPAATSDYSLVDSSATTLNHSHTFVHTPSQAPTYRLPSVSDTTVSHYIELTVDFTAVQTYSFLDYQGEPIVPLFTPSIAVGDVYTFRMEYSAIKAKWLIYPQKQGAVADDFVMRGEVGAANGVAGLDENATVPPAQLPVASTSQKGVIQINANYGLWMDSNGNIRIASATTSEINAKNNIYKPITPNGIDLAFKAALVNQNHLALTDAQKATAQSVFGVGGPITAIPAATSAYTLAEGIFTHAPTNAPTYTLPSITDNIRTHKVVLIIDFSSVQTFSFLVDGGGDVTFQSYANPTTGDVWVFRCVWYGGKWRIAPTKIKNCVTRQLANGSLAITDAVGGDALALKMTAPRSVVVNQLVQNGDFGDGTTGWHAQVGSATITDGLYKLTASGAGCGVYGSSVKITKGHIYILRVGIRVNAERRISVACINNGSYVTNEQWTTLAADTWSNLMFRVSGKSTSATSSIRIKSYDSVSGDVHEIKDIQVVDLTQYFNGDSTLIDSITSWDDLVAYDPRFVSYVEYNTGTVKGVIPAVSVNNGTAIASPSELFAVGNAADEFEAVAGVTTHKMGAVDLGTLYWVKVGVVFYARLSDVRLTNPLSICSKYVLTTETTMPDPSYKLSLGAQAINIVSIMIKDTQYDTSASFKTAMSGVYLYYELDTPTTSQSTPTQISLQSGNNVAMQTDGGRLAPIDITYESDEL